MEYCFQLYPQANIRYREALERLGQKELLCILRTIGIEAEVHTECLGGAAFLCFSADPPLSPLQLDRLSRHSALLMYCAREGELLRPLPVSPAEYLGSDLPEILKYKGKTSVPFTNMLITLAWCASAYFNEEAPVTLLDPVCGRGTALFCGLRRGMNAVGVDADGRDIGEADAYLERYLQYGRLKFARRASSRTVGGRGVPMVQYTLADTKAHYQAGDTRSLTLLTADTAATGTLLKKEKAHILTADLPYGIQHAPVDGRRP